MTALAHPGARRRLGRFLMTAILLGTWTLQAAEQRFAPMSISASSAQTGNTANQAFDGNLTTRWAASGLGQWLQADLGQTRTISSVQIAFFKGNERRSRFNIATSANGSTWTNVWASNRESSGTSVTRQAFAFPAAVSARYVRFIGAGNTASDPTVQPWNSLFELDIMGTTTSGGNQAPVVAATIPNRSATVGTAFSYTVPVGTFSDPNGDALTWSVVGLPAGLAFNASTRLISGTPTAAANATVTVTARDPGNLSASTSFIITVTAVATGAQRWAPTVITASSAETANPATHAFDGNLTTRWAAKGIGEWLQADLGQTRTISAVQIAFFKGNERRSRFNIATSANGSTWTNVWTSNRESSGTSVARQTFAFPAAVSARYVRFIGAGNTSTDPTAQPWNSLFELDIMGTTTASGNQAPVVAATIPNRSATVGTAFSYTIPAGTFSDPNGDALTWTVGGLPAGLTFNAATRLISGTPTSAVNATVTVTARDPGHLSASTTFTITVTAAPIAGGLQRLAPTTISASAAEAVNPAAHAFDGNLSTRWAANGVGQWLHADLGTTFVLSEVRIAFFSGNQRRYFFNIQTSANGSTWSNVWSSNRESSGTTTARQTFVFPATVQARYVRYVGAGSTASTWNSLFEFDIMGGASSANWPKLPQGSFTPTGVTTGIPAFTTPGGMLVRLGNRYVFAGANHDWKALTSSDETLLSSDVGQTITQVPWKPTPVLDPRQPSRLHITTPDGLPVPGATVTANGQTVTTDGHGDAVILADPTKSTSATVTLPSGMTFIGNNIFTIPVVPNTTPRIVASPSVEVEPGLDFAGDTGSTQRHYGGWDTSDVPANANGETFSNNPWFKWNLNSGWYAHESHPPSMNRGDIRLSVNGSVVTFRFRKDCITSSNIGSPVNMTAGVPYTPTRARFLMPHYWFDGSRNTPPGGWTRYVAAHPDVFLSWASDGWSHPIHIEMSGLYKRRVLASTTTYANPPYTALLTYMQVFGYQGTSLMNKGTLSPTMGAIQNVPISEPGSQPFYRLWEDSRFALLDSGNTSRVSLSDLEIVEGTAARIALVNPPRQTATASLFGDVNDLRLAHVAPQHAQDEVDRLFQLPTVASLTADDRTDSLQVAMAEALVHVLAAAVTPSEVVYEYRLKDIWGNIKEADAGRWNGSWSQLIALGSKPANERAVVLKTGNLGHGRYTVEFKSAIRLPGVDKTRFTLPAGAVWNGDWIDNGWRHGCRLLIMPSRRITFSVTFSKFPGMKKVVAAIDKVAQQLSASFEVKDKGAINGYIEWKPKTGSGFLQTTIGLGGSLEVEAKLRGPIDLSMFGVPTVLKLPPGVGASGFVGPYIEGKFTPFVSFTNFKIDYHKHNPPNWADPTSWLGGVVAGGLKGSAEIGLGVFIKSTDLAAKVSVEAKGGGACTATGMAGLDITREGISKGMLFWRSQLGQMTLIGEIKAKFEHHLIPNGGVEFKYSVNQLVWGGIKIPENKEDEWIDVFSALKQLGNEANGGQASESTMPLNYTLSP